MPGQWGFLNLAWLYTGRAGDIQVRNPNRLALNPTAQAYHQLDLHWRLPLTALNDRLPERSEIRFYLANILDESIYQPEFVGQTINTIPADAGRRARITFYWPF